MANIVKGERQNVFPLRSRTRQGHPLSLHLFNIRPEVQSGKIRQENKINGTYIEKKEVQLYLFANDMILYVEKPKDLMNSC